MLNKEFLEHQYVVLKKNGYQISRETNTPVSTVYAAMARFGVRRRNAKEAKRPDGSAGLPDHQWCPECRKDVHFSEYPGGWTKRHGRAYRSGYCKACVRVRTSTPEQAAKQNLRHRKLKAALVIEMGDKCRECGKSGLPLACYAFHHRDPSKKEAWVSRLMTSDSPRLRKELEKCDLVCLNCHAVIHASNISAGDVLQLRNINDVAVHHGHRPTVVGGKAA